MSKQRKKTRAEKELHELEFTELVDGLTWDVVQALLRGEKLRDAIWSVCNTVVCWREAVEKAGVSNAK